MVRYDIPKLPEDWKRVFYKGFKRGMMIPCDDPKNFINDKFLDYICSVDLPEEDLQQLYSEIFADDNVKVSPHWPSEGKYLGLIIDKSAGHFHNGFDFIELGNRRISIEKIEDNLIDGEFSFIPIERI